MNSRCRFGKEFKTNINLIFNIMKTFNLLSDKTQGKILLFITVFSSFGLLVLISEFTNIIHFII